MGALSRKTVLLVTHQVDFLPAFNSVLVSISNFLFKYIEILFIRYLFSQVELQQLCLRHLMAILSVSIIKNLQNLQKNSNFLLLELWSDD